MSAIDGLHRYKVKACDEYGVFLVSERDKMVSVTSSAGNYAYRWEQTGSCFRAFLADERNHEYVTTKLCHQYGGTLNRNQRGQLNCFMRTLWPAFQEAIRVRLRLEAAANELESQS